jgi:uncharacterized SAM-binding protein YcdF (DUF218 family)
MGLIFRILLFALFAFAILPICLWIGGYFFFTETIRKLEEPTKIERTQAIIVLTGGSSRIARGLELLSDKSAKYLFISGVHQGTTLDEIVVSSGFQKPAPDCCIALGHQADNTLENALEASEWVQKNNIKSLRLITANYHIPRALLEFNHVMPEVRIIPHPVIPAEPPRDSFKFSKLVFSEYHKLILSLLRVMFLPEEKNPYPEKIKTQVDRLLQLETQNP